MTPGSSKTVAFKADLQSDMEVLYKDDDGGMVIWGPASVEVVDKERDRITADALEDALPQLLRRKRLSLEHSDQLVGDILEGFETDETKTVKIDGHAYERSEFPTAVLYPDDDDVPEKGLYVAGKVWGDTQQARDTQEKIQQGTIDSYSISGEAIQSSTQVKDGEMVDNIKELDLSAVTLCEEGMNQKAKFALVSKGAAPGFSPDELAGLAGATLKSTMPENEEDEDEEEDSPDNASEAAVDKEELRSEFKAAAEEALDGKDFVTRKDVEDIVEEKMPDDEEDEELPDDEEDDLPEVDEEPDDEMPDDVEEPEDGPLGDEMAGGDDDPLDDEEMGEDPMDGEDEIETGHDVSLDTLKSELPEDLYRAVSEHLADPGDGEIALEDDEDEEDDDEEMEDEGDMDDETTEKSATEQYLETVGPPAPEAHSEVQKSYSGGDDEDGNEEIDKDTGVSVSDPGHVGELYDDSGEEV